MRGYSGCCTLGGCQHVECRHFSSQQCKFRQVAGALDGKLWISGIKLQGNGSERTLWNKAVAKNSESTGSCGELAVEVSCNRFNERHGVKVIIRCQFFPMNEHCKIFGHQSAPVRFFHITQICTITGARHRQGKMKRDI